jgi:protein-histidine N-methyltransferase
MASETIYSPSSLPAFSETLLSLLRRSNTDSAKSRALIAAKKVYFGVGGGVDEFLSVLQNVCADELEVQHKVDIQSEGVGRVVLEITPAAK